MYIKTDSKLWSRHEQGNQIIHMFFGFLVSYGMWLIGCGYWSLLGCLIGIVEMIRQMMFDNPDYSGYWIVDKIRDFLFYVIGSLFTLIIKNFPIQ